MRPAPAGYSDGVRVPTRSGGVRAKALLASSPRAPVRKSLWTAAASGPGALSGSRYPRRLYALVRVAASLLIEFLPELSKFIATDLFAVLLTPEALCCHVKTTRRFGHLSDQLEP